MNRFDRLPIAEIRNGDHPKMVEAITRLKQERIDVRRPAKIDHQLKVTEQISFYPRKGTIFIDGTSGAHERQGLEALLSLVNAEEMPCIQLDL